MKKGILIAFSISEIENRENLLKEFFSKSDSTEKEFEGILSTLLMTSPNFTHSIFQKYVKAFCDKKIKELLPFDLSKLRDILDESLDIQKEILFAYSKLSKQEKDDVLRFLDKIT
jgi:DNA-binding transcriptional regulator YbjK